MATAAAAVILAAQQDVYSHFLSQQAVSPETAVFYAPTRSFQRREFQRAIEHGVIVEADANRWFIDLAKYDEQRRSNRKTVGIVLAGAAAVLAAVLALG